MNDTILKLRDKLEKVSRNLPETRIMEVCGTHTHAVAQYGLKSLLPENIKLVSGPGCPVCVTEGGDILEAIKLAERTNITLFTFGDMMRVPVDEKAGSLFKCRGDGYDVKMAYSPMDALTYALKNPEREIVWFAVGFETTAPLTAAVILRAKNLGVKNFSVFCVHKTMPRALVSLLSGNDRINGLLCPGHVMAITGMAPFGFVPEKLHIPGAVSGFEPEEIMAAILTLAEMRSKNEAKLVNMYPSVVSEKGNYAAMKAIETVFSPCSCLWRGLDRIDGSGLEIKERFSRYDAKKRFKITTMEEVKPEKGCRCADILRGEAKVTECPLFGKRCTPEHPCGPCMVSSEGACAAEYRYGDVENG